MNLRTNSKTICRKVSVIWTGQVILQSAHGKPGCILVLLIPSTGLISSQKELDETGEELLVGATHHMLFHELEGLD